MAAIGSAARALVEAEAAAAAVGVQWTNAGMMFEAKVHTVPMAGPADVSSVDALFGAGRLDPEHITPELLGAQLCLNDAPEPDLFIRSGGEQRISNYLLWQLAYTELHFTDCLWPDFDRTQFDVALESFARRQRRFGMTGEQVEQAVPAAAAQSLGTP